MYAISAPPMSEKESFSEIETRVLKIVAANEAKKARKINLSLPTSQRKKEEKQAKTKKKKTKEKNKRET